MHWPLIAQCRCLLVRPGLLESRAVTCYLAGLHLPLSDLQCLIALPTCHTPAQVTALLCPVQEETALDAVQLCDQVLGAGIGLEAGLSPLYAAAMLLLCCRQCEPKGGSRQQRLPCLALLLSVCLFQLWLSCSPHASICLAPGCSTLPSAVCLLPSL